MVSKLTIIHLSGGFGNQLFSYAFGYAVAKARGDKLAIDTAIQDAPWFFRNPDILEMKITYDKRITYPIGRSLFQRGIWNKVCFRKAIGLFTKFLTENDLKNQEDPIAYCKSVKGNLYLKGNWGNESWFSSVKQDIPKKYQFMSPLSEEAQRIANEINSCENPVTVHIRRGDYVKIGIALEKDYFQQAMEVIEKQISNPVFYCFSEDMQWAKESFKGLPYQIKYVDYESPNKGIEDFRLLMEGKHQIISNSSYSWWAAYLNPHTDKKVVIPCKEGSMWDHEFMVPGWIPLDFCVNGKQKG